MRAENQGLSHGIGKGATHDRIDQRVGLIELLLVGSGQDGLQHGNLARVKIHLACEECQGIRGVVNAEDIKQSGPSTFRSGGVEIPPGSARENRAEFGNRTACSA